MLQNEWIKKWALVCLGLAICLCAASLTRAAGNGGDYLNANAEDI